MRRNNEKNRGSCTERATGHTRIKKKNKKQKKKPTRFPCNECPSVRKRRKREKNRRAAADNGKATPKTGGPYEIINASHGKKTHPRQTSGCKQAVAGGSRNGVGQGTKTSQKRIGEGRTKKTRTIKG